MLKCILYLFLRTNRIYNDEPILNSTSCKAFCSEKDGHLIDADLFSKMEIKIQDEERKEDGYAPIQMFNFGERNVLLNIIYDFEKKQWKNGITKSVLNNSIWLTQYNSLPIYPNLNDLLGKITKQFNRSFQVNCMNNSNFKL